MIIKQTLVRWRLKFLSFHWLIQKSARFETRRPVSRSQSDRHYVFCSQFLEEARKTRGEGKDPSFALNGRQVLSWRTPLRMRTGSPLRYLSLFLSFSERREILADERQPPYEWTTDYQHQYCQFNNFTVTANLEPFLRDKNEHITIQHKNLFTNQCSLIIRYNVVLINIQLILLLTKSFCYWHVNTSCYRFSILHVSNFEFRVSFYCVHACCNWKKNEYSSWIKYVNFSRVTLQENWR